ncbi:hypothetical protein GGQ54_001718 [Naumannella cuiyingiana]|uniref:Prenyltransferase n=1 Tax=Naumannella cuiyingiana TaxID=1347891 RepID=A0A7Z0D9H8_9ACTN|nr:prenyltransferase [Naumannella cuiyingiana]NYI71158.1 hypothetical protein [Naumannella cuiyingiana]
MTAITSRAVPVLPGVLSAAEVRATGAGIAAMQHPSGAIPWFTGGHIDPWDHVEAAMGLAVAGFVDEAERAYRWSAATQRPDGSWPIKINADETVADDGTDANFISYLAVGVWHQWLVTGDDRFLAELWPIVRAAVDKVCGMRTTDGMIAWAEDARGNRFDEALVSGSASVHHSLTAALALAEAVGERRPDWVELRARIADDLGRHPERFADRRRWSMDWYYPVLGGAITGEAARARLSGRWEEFVVPGLGIRCVADRPWVTGAETCELAICLAGLGDRDGAERLLADMQHLREADGNYWTGLVFSDGLRWPEELSSWTAAAMLLAADAITVATAGHRVHRPAR